MRSRQANWLQSALKLASNIQPSEIRATLVSFALVFMLMAGYYILRPLRDAMASDWSDAELSWLWTATFLFSAFAVWLYAAVITRIRFRYLVVAVYGFFAFSFIVFYLISLVSGDGGLSDKSFYVWISVFSLFHISVFWSLMADVFTRTQSKRLFGFIGAGASVGAILGPAIPLLLVPFTGIDLLLLFASFMLLLTIPLTFWVLKLKAIDLQVDNQDTGPGHSEFIGGNPFSGFTAFFQSPYLLGIGVFILLYTSISSFVYFELKNLLIDYDRETRTQIWAAIDLVVNILTVSVAVFITGRVASRFGLSVTLTCVPVLIAAGLIVLAMAPLVSVVIGLQIIRRAGNYAITRPGREMLFTQVDRDTRFKVKPVIDIVLYRGGDMLNAWAFTALTQGFGLSLSAVSVIGALIAGIWAGTGIYLGKTADRKALEHSSEAGIIESRRNLEA